MARPELVTIFGGGGFIGRYVVQQLARQGYRIRVASRRPDLAFSLQPLGGVGQIQPVQANVRYPESVTAALQGADHVVNLVAILVASGPQTFPAVISEGAKTIAQAAAAAGLDRMVHISAIGADATSSSEYGQTKAEAEAAVLKALPNSVILRPSIVFGPEDAFFNRFAKMATMFPAIPLVGADTKFQPVYVEDVASAITASVMGQAQPGATYELGGARVASFQELIDDMLRVIGRKRLVLPVPEAAGTLMAKVLQFAPGDLKLTPDQVAMLAHDNVVSEAAMAEKRTLEGLGIEPRAMAGLLEQYLVRYRAEGQFTKIDRNAKDTADVDL